MFNFPIKVRGNITWALKEIKLGGLKVLFVRQKFFFDLLKKLFGPILKF
jgi:hypothetical protein